MRAAWRTVREQRGAFAGVFVALVFAAALIGACGVLLESALRAHARVERYAGADAVVTAEQRIAQRMKPLGADPETQTRPLAERVRVPVSLADRLRAVPGVRDVVPDVSFPVTAAEGGTMAGHGWRSAALGPYGLHRGRAPRAAGEVVLGGPARVRIGGVVHLQTTGLPRPYRVTGLATGPPAAYFTEETAARLSGHPGRADALAVLGDVDQDRLRRAVPGLVVATGAARGDAEDISMATARPDIVDLAGAMGGVGAMVAIVVVTGLLALSIRERARELALLRAVGATPWQLRGRAVREVLVVAFPAAGLGAALSLAVGAGAHAVLAEQGAMPPGWRLVLGPLPPLVGLAGTVVVAVAAAFLATLRTSRIRPAQALGEAAVERPRLPLWRLVTGGSFLVLGIGALVLSAFTRGEAAAASIAGQVVALITATALLGPLIAGIGTRVIGGRLRVLSPVAGRLAERNSRAASARLGAAVTPIALAVAFAATQLFVQATVVHATQTQSAEGVRADQVVVSDGPGVPPAVLDAVRRAPGVRAATAVKHTTVVMRQNVLGEPELLSVPAQGITPDGADATMDPRVTAGELADLRGDTVALSAERAGGARIGSIQPLWLGDGTPVRARVVAIYERGLGFGEALLPRDLVAAHASSALDDHVLVKGGSGLDAVAQRFAGLRVADRSEPSARLARDLRLQGVVSYLVTALIAGFTAIGVVTTLALATVSRRRELALLRMVGATRRQILRMLRLEAVVVLGTGIAVGTLIAGPTLVMFAVAVTGLPAPSVPPIPCASILAFVIVTGSAAILLPARSMLRRDTP
ncbi:MAG TPA: ABC transporter permease [Thermomonospora sp.]|nr:ABC transporter permease [Thermomonospora sp.]